MPKFAEPHLFVVLGGAGDLARRKLLPALFRLHASGRAGAGSRVLAAGLSPYDDRSYREIAVAALSAAGLRRHTLTSRQTASSSSNAGRRISAPARGR